MIFGVFFLLVKHQLTVSNFVLFPHLSRLNVKLKRNVPSSGFVPDVDELLTGTK